MDSLVVKQFLIYILNILYIEQINLNSDTYTYVCICMYKCVMQNELSIILCLFHIPVFETSLFVAHH